MLRDGTNRLGAVDTDALEAYLMANLPALPPAQNRITPMSTAEINRRKI